MKGVIHPLIKCSRNALKICIVNTKKCGCSSSSSYSRSKDSDHKDEPIVQDLLDDAALGTGPLDEVDEDDEWLSSPYPQGSIINPKQSQCLKSLRPKVNPKDTSIILFPGQGSQYVGMGRELLKFPAAKDVFDAASEILKYDILKLMLTGPSSKLNETKYCQPAIVVCSLAALEKLKEERPSALENCIATAGFSVGEITALAFAGVFKFSDAIKLVRVRAEAMQLAAEMNPGGMATVVYKHDTKLKTALQKAREWCLDKGIENPECRIANYLDPNMKVVAGHTEALKYLECNKNFFNIVELKKLPYTVAYHSHLMMPAVPDFKRKLKKMKINEPLVTVHSNVDGCFYKNAVHIYNQLPKQIYKPLKWEQTMHILYERAQDSNFPLTALEFLETNYRQFNIRKIKKISVSGAFHTDLMKPAVEPFRAALRNVQLSEPYCHVWSNVTAKRYLDLETVEELLPQQIYKPVLWEQMIQKIYKRPKEVELPNSYTCGPGTSLKTILRANHNKAASKCEPILA